MAGRPVRQRQDQTEVRVRPGDVPQVMRTLHDEPDLRFEYLADLCGVTPAPRSRSSTTSGAT